MHRASPQICLTGWISRPLCSRSLLPFNTPPLRRHSIPVLSSSDALASRQNRRTRFVCPRTYFEQPRPLLSHPQRRTIRTVPIGKRKHIRTSRFNNHPRLPILGATPAAAYQRKLDADTLPLRTGVLAVKKGMTAVYVDASGTQAVPSDPRAGKPMDGGRRIPATILQMDRVQVVANKTRERHGYYAVVVGEGWRKPSRVGKAMLGVFANAKVGQLTARASMEDPAEMETDQAGEAQAQKQGHVGLPPKREIREFKVRDESGLLPIGTFIAPDWFRVGQYIDARGTARGMGFAGGMKRYGFKGQPASHGVSLTHRSMGSAGGGQGSGSRVHPGKRMPGNMGGQRHTIQSLKVLMVDPKNGLVVVTGAVSGRKGDLVLLSDAIKKPWPTAEQ